MTERRKSHVPIGRPRKGTEKERAKEKKELTEYGKSLLKKKTEKKPAATEPKMSERTSKELSKAYDRRRRGKANYILPFEETVEIMVHKARARYPALLKDVNAKVLHKGRTVRFYLQGGPLMFFKFKTHMSEGHVFTDDFDYALTMYVHTANGLKQVKEKTGTAKIKKFESVFNTAVMEYADQVRKWKELPVSTKTQAGSAKGDASAMKKSVGIPDQSKRSDLNVKRLTDMSLFPEHTNWDFTSADGDDGYYVIFKDGPIKTKVRIRFKERTDPRMLSSWHMDYKVTIPGEKTPYSEYNGGQTTKGVSVVLKKASSDVRKAYSIYNKREAEKSASARASSADKKDGGKIARFEVGKSYVMVYPTDHELKSVYTVVSRTASYVTLTGENDRRCKVHVRANEEFCYPDGRYSMCPVLSAARPKTGAASKPATPLKVKPRLPSRS